MYPYYKDSGIEKFGKTYFRFFTTLRSVLNDNPKCHPEPIMRRISSLNRHVFIMLRLRHVYFFFMPVHEGLTWLWGQGVLRIFRNVMECLRQSKTGMVRESGKLSSLMIYLHTFVSIVIVFQER
jgi:hypothetical protein